MEEQPAVPATADYPGGGGKGKIIAIIILAVFLIATLIFGGWAYSNMNNYKNKTNQKINQALAAKSAQLQTQAQNAFDAVNTYRYDGSPTYGSISFRYPKTWSAYVDTTNNSEPINGYFYPSQVPGLQSKTAYALRVELVNSDYTQLLQSYTSLISEGKVTSKAYVPPKLAGAANVTPGVYLSGQINNSDPTQNGDMVIIKVRDKTLQIYTESQDFKDDFNNVILAGLAFAP